MLQRNGKVYTEIVPDCAKATLQAIIRRKADLGECDPLRRLERLQWVDRSWIQKTFQSPS